MKLLIAGAVALLAILTLAACESDAQRYARLDRETAEQKDLNQRFTDMEMAFWPKPVDLRGKNVLIIGYEDLFFGNDLGNALLDGTSGARVYYARYAHPGAPDFSQPVDLRAIVQGRARRQPGTHHGVLYQPLSGGEVPRIDHVMVDMREPITPILTRALPRFGFEPDAGRSWDIFAPVPNDRAYQMTPDNAHYINFSRDPETFGTYNSWHSTYNFPNGPDRAQKEQALQNMVCGPQATNRGYCAR